jgi:hypothetical protein
MMILCAEIETRPVLFLLWCNVSLAIRLCISVPTGYRHCPSAIFESPVGERPEPHDQGMHMGPGTTWSYMVFLGFNMIQLIQCHFEGSTEKTNLVTTRFRGSVAVLKITTKWTRTNLWVFSWAAMPGMPRWGWEMEWNGGTWTCGKNPQVVKQLKTPPFV